MRNSTEGTMSKSRWQTMTAEQKAHHAEMEKKRRDARRQRLTPEEMEERKEKRRVSARKRNSTAIGKVANAEYKRNGKGWFYSWANTIKTRAAKKDIPCDIDADYLMSIYTGVCPVFGVPLCRRNGRRDTSAWSPTVDRIVPALGYVQGNVIIVSRRANNIKSDASVKEIIQVAEYYANLGVPGSL